MQCFDLISNVDWMGLTVPLPVALAAVATLGYVLGRGRTAARHGTDARSKRELRRARCVARELEKIAHTVRKNISRHHASMSKFKQRVDSLDAPQRDAAWKAFCREAEGMLAPTLQLANQIANAYDQIQQHSGQLMGFADAHTDPLTGAGSRCSLEDTLDAQFALMSRYENGFSVAIFDIDHLKGINDRQGQLQGDRLIARLAALLDDCKRETDVMVRYGGEEFLVVMPQTDLEGACTFADRWRRRVEDELPLRVSGGVTTALDGDTSDSLLGRADAALYSAKSAGRNRVFRHTGERIDPVTEPRDTRSEELAV